MYSDSGSSAESSASSFVRFLALALAILFVAFAPMVNLALCKMKDDA